MGTYEPSVFILEGIVIRSSRAAEPGLADTPGCQLLHRDCFDEPEPGPHLRLVTD